MPKRLKDAAKRYPLNMRTTKALREKLEKSATASGRSLAQEVELRLERSYWIEDITEVLDRVVDELRALGINLPEKLQ